MKRIVTLLLALVLLLSTISFAGAKFKDDLLFKDKYRYAIDYMAEKGIIGGFPDGTFSPRGTLTRAQAAKILCVMLEGAEKADALTKTDTGFSDVPATHWAAKYVAYCAEKGIVAGVGDGKFDPDGKLSGAAFGKMLLVAYGEDPAKFTGGKWMQAVQDSTKGAMLNFKLDDSTFTNRSLPREEAAQMGWDAMFHVESQKAATQDMQSKPLAQGVPEKLKLYAIGNSFSNNCTLFYLYDMLKSVGVKELTIANLYYSGCSLQTHWKFLGENKNNYQYYKRTDADKEFVKNDGYTFDAALNDDQWDIVTMQQVPSTSFNPAKNRLMYYVQMHQPEVNFVWNMIWAHAKTSKQSAFLKTWKGDQMHMYTGMTESVVKNVEPDPRIRFIIPTGTAIQNARTSFLGDNLDRDGYHLNEGIGYYIAAMVWTCKITGLRPDQISYVPDDLLKNPPHNFDANTPGLQDAMVRVAKESVANALDHPYEVTESKILSIS